MTTIKHFPHIPHPNHQKAPDETFYAITGGIGSGKSFVCKRLEALGIKVYDCDAGAKRLMRSSKQLQDELRRLVGDDVYSSGRNSLGFHGQALHACELKLRHPRSHEWMSFHADLPEHYQAALNKLRREKH